VQLTISDGSMMSGALEYATDLFTEATAATLVDRFESLLRSATADPAAPVSELAVVRPDEREQILAWSSGPEVQLDSDATLVELFRAAVAAHPQTPALRAGQQQYTYRQLWSAASGLARRLRAHGVGRRDVVAVAMPRSTEQVISLYAALLAGAAYCPLDPDAPPQRMRDMLADARAAVLLTCDDRKASMQDVLDSLQPEGSDPPALLIFEPADVADDADDDDSDLTGRSDASADDTAYVIYTSGSTGRPKGVMVSHRSIVNRLAWMQAQFPLDRSDRVLQKTPATFDVSVWEFFWPLQTGACLVLTTPDGHRDPAVLLRAMREENITTLHFVPSMLDALLASMDETGEEAGDALRRVICSGEALPSGVAARAESLLRVPVFNLYGPTEAAVDVTCRHFDPAIDVTSVSLGEPIWNTQTYVLDASLQPVPAGVPGELYLGGVQLARGYVHRPGLTAERFLANPYGPPGSRLYRTGDIARWSADGQLHYLGRVDHQVKIRGQRIELGEIEHVLRSFPDIREAVVLADRNSATGAVRLLGYVVPNTLDRLHDQDTAEALLEHAAAFLPDHMLPATIQRLSSLPTTPNGKLDRAALPRPEASAPADRRQPRTEREEQLSALFHEILGAPALGVDEGFFELGGDSILALRLVARARQHGLALTPADVFAHPTVAGLAAQARELSAAERTEPAAAGTGPLQATPILRWLEDGGGSYDGFAQAVVLHAPAGLRDDVLAAALRAVVDTHDMLRLRRTPDGFEVRPAGTASVPISRVVARGGQQNDQLIAAAQQARQSLDPAAGEMLRAVVLEGSDRTLLLLVISHLAVDAVSWRVLLPDLIAAYESVAAGNEVELHRPATSYRRWAQHLFAMAHGSERIAELGYWLSVLNQVAPVIARDGSDPNPGKDTAASAQRITVTVPAEVTDILASRTAASVHGTVQDVLLAALAIAVNDLRPARATSAAKAGVVVTVEGHGRETLSGTADVSGTVGWFTSLHPVALSPGDIRSSDVLAGRADLNSALKRIKEQLRSARDGGIGYGMLRYLNQETASRLADCSEPEVLFNYLGHLTGTAEPGDPAAWSLAAESRLVADGADPDMPLRHALTIDAGIFAGELTATWSWAPSCCEDTAIAKLADRWVEILVAFAGDESIGGFTPTDLLVDLDQKDIDALEEMWGTLS
jgi:amino acid adenylation domain-containing protein/non-ribosomal peptide synthase protein (TIGR01720 family)